MQAPKLTFNLDGLHLTPESQTQGWRESSFGNALILVHAYGHTVALHCAGFDRGSQVAATYTIVTMSTSKITENMNELNEISQAFNDAINQVFVLMQHYG